MKKLTWKTCPVNPTDKECAVLWDSLDERERSTYITLPIVGDEATDEPWKNLDDEDHELIPKWIRAAKRIEQVKKEVDKPIKLPSMQPADPKKLNAETFGMVLTFNGIGNHRKVDLGNVEVQGEKDMYAVSKMLLDSPELQAVSQHDSATRRWVEGKAMPSQLKKGVYLLLQNDVNAVTEYLQQRAIERRKLVDTLIAVYPQRVREAKEKLKGDFNPKDYPDADYIRTKFRLSWQFVTFNTPTSLAEINKEIYERERAKAEEGLKENVEMIMSSMRQGALEVVERLLNLLEPKKDGGRKAITDSALPAVNQYIETIRQWQKATGDTQLAAVAERMERVVGGIEKGALQENEGTRDFVKAGFERVKSTLTTMVENAPKRPITFEEVA